MNIKLGTNISSLNIPSINRIVTFEVAFKFLISNCFCDKVNRFSHACVFGHVFGQSEKHTLLFIYSFVLNRFVAYAIFFKSNSDRRNDWLHLILLNAKSFPGKVLKKTPVKHKTCFPAFVMKFSKNFSRILLKFWEIAIGKLDDTP